MVKATIILGEDAVKHYNETGIPPSVEWLMDKGGVVDEKEFQTKAEYDAYVQALSDASGWGDYEVIGLPDVRTESELPVEASIWMRLGITVTGSREEIEKILQGDEAVLASLLKKKKFNIDGETYIPSSCIEEYNNQNKTSFEEEDIEFHSLNV